MVAGLLAPTTASADPRVVIRGGGFGHGLGMSQYGAYGYAEHGATAEEILTHYYRSTTVGRVDTGSIRVGLLPFYGGSQSQVAVSSADPPYRADGGKVRFYVRGARKDTVAIGGAGSSFVVKASRTGGMKIFQDGSEVKVDGVTVFGDRSHALVLTYEKFGSLVHVGAKNRDYAYGHMVFETYPTSSCDPGFCLRLVAVMPMQRYLYGLGEMPSSWPQAALQSQAIAGRTYALNKISRIGQHRYPCDCAVYDSTVDQSYIGDAKRRSGYWAEWRSAVDSTAGMVVLYEGRPIQALYSASSGGYTEDNENVWGGSPLPYLRGVPDPYDDTGSNPYHQWRVEMSWTRLADELDAAYGIGKVRKIKLDKPFGVSGRVTVVKTSTSGGVTIVGSRKTVRESGWSLRSALGLRDTLFRIRITYEIGDDFIRLYRRLDGAPGKPTGDVYAVPRGSAHPKGRAQDFRHGRMTWRAYTGKNVWQHGAVLHKYDRMGRERSRLGMPTSNVWGPGAYRGATYSRGMIVWSQAGSARAIWGAFLPAYRHNGGVKGPLGVPISGRHRSATLPDGGKVQDFQNGALYLNPYANKAYGLWGPVAHRYSRIGAASSQCGYPVAHMKVTTAGAVGHFQHGTITAGRRRTVVRCS